MDKFCQSKVWSAVWRLLMVFGSVYLLMYLGSVTLPIIHSTIYSANLFFFAVILTLGYMRLYTNSGQTVLDSVFDGEYDGQSKISEIVVKYLLNYVALILIFVLFFGGAPFVSAGIANYVQAALGASQGIGREISYIAISIYTALCAIFLPTPSEAPLLFSNQLNLLYETSA